MSVIKSLPSWGQKHSWENCFPQNRGMRRAYPLGFTVISSNITDSFTSHALEKTHILRTTGLWNYPWAVKYFWGKKWEINLHLIVCFICLWNPYQCVLQSNLSICLRERLLVYVHMHTNAFGCCIPSNLTNVHLVSHMNALFLRWSVPILTHLTTFTSIKTILFAK